MDAINLVQGFVEGEYGLAHAMQVVDVDGVGVDLTVYTGVSLKAVSPDYQETLTFTGSGSDSSGNFSVTPSTGNTFSRDGNYLGQVQLTTATKLVMTNLFTLKVDKQL